MSIQNSAAQHEVAYTELTALLRRHASQLSAFEMLAIVANMVGKLVALQDQRIVTPEMAMRTVAANIEIGNQQVVDLMKNTAGKA